VTIIIIIITIAAAAAAATMNSSTRYNKGSTLVNNSETMSFNAAKLNWQSQLTLSNRNTRTLSHDID